jgi:hypothetical protein
MIRSTTFPLRGIHTGQTATVVGRGPSLLRLTSADFGSGPVIALNHSLIQIRNLGLTNPLYSMQKDGCLVPPMDPETVILAAAQSKRCWPNYPKRYVIDVTKLGMTVSAMSTTFAVAMAHIMGCSRVRMLACDGYTVGDFRTVQGGELVTIGRGYSHAGEQATNLARRLRIGIEWVAP